MIRTKAKGVTCNPGIKKQKMFTDNNREGISRRERTPGKRMKRESRHDHLVF